MKQVLKLLTAEEEAAKAFDVRSENIRLSSGSEGEGNAGVGGELGVGVYGPLRPHRATQFEHI